MPLGSEEMRRHTGLNPRRIYGNFPANETDTGVFLNAVSFLSPRKHLTAKLGCFLEIFFNSFFLIFLGEMGDKTQLLALLLAARFRRPYPILAGIFVATILNHALAVLAGNWVASFLPETALRWILAGSFFAFALWALIPDKETDSDLPPRFGAFLTTLVAFFLAEMGDKTQLATIALGARYANLGLVTVATTMGMMASNALAIFFGHKLLARIPMKWVRGFACFSFFLFGIAILVST